MSYGNSGSQRPTGYSSPSSPSGSYLSDEQPPRKSSNAVWWVLGILGVLGVGSLLVCCGGGYMMYLIGTQAVAELIKPQIQNDVSVQEHIGEIQSMSLDLGATKRRNEQNVTVFSIQGSKGSGELEILNGKDGNAASCVLVLPDGRRFDVVLEQEEDWSTDDIDEGSTDDASMNADETLETEQAETSQPKKVPAVETVPDF